MNIWREFYKVFLFRFDVTFSMNSILQYRTEFYSPNKLKTNWTVIPLKTELIFIFVLIIKYRRKSIHCHFSAIFSFYFFFFFTRINFDLAQYFA